SSSRLLFFFLIFFFFFSSRRRHTRFSRDWSSDVCSSDLTGGVAGAPAATGFRTGRGRRHHRRQHPPGYPSLADCPRLAGGWLPGSPVAEGPAQPGAVRGGSQYPIVSGQQKAYKVLSNGNRFNVLNSVPPRTYAMTDRLRTPSSQSVVTSIVYPAVMEIDHV